MIFFASLIFSNSSTVVEHEIHVDTFCIHSNSITTLADVFVCVHAPSQQVENYLQIILSPQIFAPHSVITIIFIAQFQLLWGLLLHSAVTKYQLFYLYKFHTLCYFSVSKTADVLNEFKNRHSLRSYTRNLSTLFSPYQFRI
jgi:hypothetical protein